MIPFFDLSTQYSLIQSEINDGLRRLFSTSQFVGGTFVSQFETNFAAACHVRHARGVGSGTDALRLGITALKLAPGSEVIVAANTFYSCVSTILENNLKPRLIDCTPDGSGLDLDQLEHAITHKTSAVLVVHLFGQPDNMDAILAIIRSKKPSIRLIEDCAQAHMAHHKGKLVGTFGDLATFSFYPTKNLGAYGDAGAVTTNKKSYADAISLLREYGQRKKYHHETIGTNSRLDAIQAVILDVKLRHINEWNTRRQKNAQHYFTYLKNCNEVLLPPYFPDRPSVYHLYTIRAKKRGALQKQLLQMGVQTQIHYPIPLHLQKAFAHLAYKKGDFPNAESFARDTLSLPMYPELSQKSIQTVSEKIVAFYEK